MRRILNDGAVSLRKMEQLAKTYGFFYTGDDSSGHRRFANFLTDDIIRTSASPSSEESDFIESVRRDFERVTPKIIKIFKKAIDSAVRYTPEFKYDEDSSIKTTETFIRDTKDNKATYDKGEFGYMKFIYNKYDDYGNIVDNREIDYYNLKYFFK